MRASGGIIEIEVKLPAASPGAARARLARLPAAAGTPRRFEDNEIFDTPEGRLAHRGSLLRLRVLGGTGLITYKEPVETDLHAKVRAELESCVSRPEAVREILRKLGLVRVYRYQKYRTDHRWVDPATGEALKVTLDETPIGTFIELEGPKRSIDRAAAVMGYAEADYILQDYRSLHRDWLAERRLPAGDMLLRDAAPGGDRSGGGSPSGGGRP